MIVSTAGPGAPRPARPSTALVLHGGSARRGEGAGTAAQRATLYAFAAMLFTLIVLQKFGVPAAGTVASFSLIGFSLSHLYLVFRGVLKLNPVRLILYSLFLVSAIVSQFFATLPPSFPSLLLVALIYFICCFEIQCSKETYLKCLSMFQNAIVGVCGLTLLQHAIQIVWSADYWINLDELIPPSFRYVQFVYLQPLEWGSRFYKPNAYFFLEVSILSQFVGMALLIEVIWFQRLWRLALYSVVMLSAFAGTGLLLVLSAMPLVLLRTSPRVAGLLAAALLILPPAVFLSGWYEAVQHRITELNRPHTSGNQRFVAPVIEMREFYKRPESIYSGKGAGNILQNPDIVWWSLAKVSVEYGLISTVLFHIFLIHMLFSRTPTRRLALGLLVSFVFLNGSLAVPVNGFICYLLAGLLRPDLSIRRLNPGGLWATAFDPRRYDQDGVARGSIPQRSATG